MIEVIHYKEVFAGILTPERQTLDRHTGTKLQPPPPLLLCLLNAGI